MPGLSDAYQERISRTRSVMSCPSLAVSAEPCDGRHRATLPPGWFVRAGRPRPLREGLPQCSRRERDGEEEGGHFTSLEGASPAERRGRGACLPLGRAPVRGCSSRPKGSSGRRRWRRFRRSSAQGPRASGLTLTPHLGLRPRRRHVAGVVEVDQLAQRLEVAVVRVRRGRRDVAQVGTLNLPSWAGVAGAGAQTEVGRIGEVERSPPVFEVVRGTPRLRYEKSVKTAFAFMPMPPPPHFRPCLRRPCLRRPCRRRPCLRRPCRRPCGTLSSRPYRGRASCPAAPES